MNATAEIGNRKNPEKLQPSLQNLEHLILFFSSCNMKLNLDFLLETLWEYLSLIRVYTKKPGAPPDFDDGLILRKGVTVEHVCHSIHRTLAAQFKYALVWVIS